MRCTVLAVALAACSVPADEPAPDAAALRPAEAADTAAIAFVDVAVATMDSPAIAQHQTVVVEGGTIRDLGPVDRIAIPRLAQRIDGHGKFLIPGLHDMHVHLDGTRSMLALFVGAGVTTVRNMAGSPRILALRDRVKRGELLGPTIYTAGPFVDGARPRWEASAAVKTPADAERIVAEQVAAGYDFIKVYNGLTVENYDAVAAAAKAHGIRIVGHVPFAVPLDHVLAAGQASIEHLSGYAEAIEREDSPVRHRRTETSVIRRWLFADTDRIPGVAVATAHAGAWSCPTLITAVAYGELWRGHTPKLATDLDTVSPDWRARWDPAHSPAHLDRAKRKAMEQAHDKTLEVERALVRELAAQGAPLLAGTDTPNPYVVPGQSLHQELGELVTAGLTPYAALRAATSDAGEFLGDPHDGHIAVGAHADLVMLDADPIADLHALDSIAGVMVRGRWLPAETLRALRDERVAEYQAPAWLAPIDLDGRAIHYVVSDNGTAVGAYAMSRQGGKLTEKQTLEDETITTHATYHEHRLRGLALDVERPEGTTHAEHAAGAHALVAAFSPATAVAIVDSLVIEADTKVTLAIDVPDPDAPATLLRGVLEVSHLDTPISEGQRAFRLRLTIDHVAWAARLIVDPDGNAHMLRVSWTSRPINRTWTRKRSLSNSASPPRQARPEPAHLP